MSKNESYDFLYDNGFFEPIKKENLNIDNTNKSEFINLEKNIPIINPSNNSKSKIKKFLCALWDNSGIITAGTTGGIFFISLFFYNFDSVGAMFALIIHIFITLWLLLFSGDIGDCIAKHLYAKYKKLHFGQILYTLDFNLDIIPVKLNTLIYNGDEVKYECSVDKITNKDNFFEFNENELFHNPAAAAKTADGLRIKRTAKLSEILGDKDKAEAFQTSINFFEYSKKFYRITILREFYEFIHIYDSVYDFLMSKESLMAFCKFIKMESREMHKQKLKEEKENSFMNNFIKDTITLVADDPERCKNDG